MTTLLPVAESPTNSDMSPSSASELASHEDRAAFGALVDDAIASIEPRADQGSPADTGGGADGSADAPEPHDDEHAAVTVVPPVMTLPVALALALPTTAAPAVQVAEAAPACTDLLTGTTPLGAATTIAVPAEAAPENPALSVDVVPPALAAQPAPQDAAGAPLPPAGAADPTAVARDVPANAPRTAPASTAADDDAVPAEPLMADATPWPPGRHDPAAPPMRPVDGQTAAPTTVHATAPMVAPSADATPVAAPPSVPHEVAAPGAPAPAWQQVAHAVRSVDRGSDGSHRMTVRLDPPELGTVDIEVRVHEGRLSVHATSDNAPTRDLIARALPELRAALESSGLSTGSLDVGARSTGNGANTHDGDPARGSARATVAHRRDNDDSARPTGERSPATTLNRLDLRL